MSNRGIEFFLLPLNFSKLWGSLKSVMGGRGMEFVWGETRHSIKSLVKKEIQNFKKGFNLPKPK